MVKSDFTRHGYSDSTSPGRGTRRVVPTDTPTDIWPDEFARDVEVWTAGTFTFVGPDGETGSRTITEGMVPYVLGCAVHYVKATGTDPGMVIEAIR